MASEAIETDVSRAKKSIVAVLLAIILIVFAGLYTLLASSVVVPTHRALLLPDGTGTTGGADWFKLSACGDVWECISDSPPYDGNTTIAWSNATSGQFNTTVTHFVGPSGVTFLSVTAFMWWRNNNTASGQGLDPYRLALETKMLGNPACSASDATPGKAFVNTSWPTFTTNCAGGPLTLAAINSFEILSHVEVGQGDNFTISSIGADVVYRIDSETASRNLAGLIPFVAIGAAVMLLVLSLPSFAASKGEPPADPPAKPLGTIRRGKVKVRSPRQMRWLHSRLNEGDPRGNHTHFFYRGGRYRAVRHTVRRR